jgi:hypothetical protein
MQGPSLKRKIKASTVKTLIDFPRTIHITLTNLGLIKPKNISGKQKQSSNTERKGERRDDLQNHYSEDLTAGHCSSCLRKEENQNKIPQRRSE